MPVFEYRCKKCEKIFEVLTHPGDEKNAVSCEYCGKTDVEKLFSRVNVSGGRSKSAPPSCPTCPGAGGGDVPPCAGSGGCSL